MSDNFFLDFDKYCEDNNIIDEDVPIAFAAFLNLKTGWDGEFERITPE